MYFYIFGKQMFTNIFLMNENGEIRNTQDQYMRPGFGNWYVQLWFMTILGIPLHLEHELNYLCFHLCSSIMKMQIRLLFNVI